MQDWHRFDGNHKVYCDGVLCLPDRHDMVCAYALCNLYLSCSFYFLIMVDESDKVLGGDCLCNMVVYHIGTLFKDFESSVRQDGKPHWLVI